MEREGRFPKLRIIWFLIPTLIVFLFFPFRIMQWLSLLAFFLLVGTYAFSFILYSSIGVSAQMPVTYGYRGQELGFSIDVINESRLAAVNLALTVFTPSEIQSQLKAQALLTVRGRDRERFRIPLEMRRRGEYSISPVILDGCDPFGLFPWQVRFRGVCTLVIYPTIHRAAFKPERGFPGGSMAVQNRIYEDSTRIGSIRDYMPGDDLRRIHWKASAKTGELRTNQLLFALDAPAVILLDLDVESYPRRYRHEHIERAVEIAATLAHRYGLLKQRIGFVSNGSDGGSPPVVPPQGTESSGPLLLRILARIQPGRGGADPVSAFLAAGFAVQAGMSCLLITPRSPEFYAAQLHHPRLVALRPFFFHLGGDAARVQHPGITYRRVPDLGEDWAIEV